MVVVDLMTKIMNIKDWKKFSHLVDEYNKFEIKGDGDGDGTITYIKPIEKTIENYYEWKAGKLKL